MRLFIAINFTDATRSKLHDLQNELHFMSIRGRYTNPDNMHLTLAFLGECDMEQYSAAITAMAACNFKPFDIWFYNVGRFRRDGGDIWWVGLHDSNQLTSLHLDLTYHLASVGFELERRRFSPHVTIGREVYTHEKPWQVEAFKEPVSSIDLMKSERINGKMVYTIIASAPENG